jgi:hypothetical protein
VKKRLKALAPVAAALVAAALYAKGWVPFGFFDGA